MLKQAASGVLASFRPSTYPRGYASAHHSLRPCWTARLSILQKSPRCARMLTIEDPRAYKVFPQPACLDQRAGERPQNHPFPTMHPARFFFAPLMIVATEVQNAVNQEHC